MPLGIFKKMLNIEIMHIEEIEQKDSLLCCFGLAERVNSRVIPRQINQGCTPHPFGFSGNFL